MGAWTLALSWARPAAAWALALPVLLLLLVRIFARPPQVVIGTLELWRELPAASASTSRSALRYPAWVWSAALALLCGALASLGARGVRGPAPRTWTVVVDRSPSMGLLLQPPAPGTRLEAALAAARTWLSQAARPDERVRWLAPERAPLELARDEQPDPTWLAPAADGAEPEWELYDQAGSLWLTDRRPGAARTQASLFASGGAAVEGPIAADGRESVSWQGGELHRVARDRAPSVQVSEPAGASLPAVLERVLTAWCRARGFELVRAPRADTLLVLALVPGEGEAERLELWRDGWRATGQAAARAEGKSAGADEDWLVGRAPSGALQSVVGVQSGRIELALRTFSEPSGDPASFALSWARLFERAARALPEVVPLAERVAAGTGVTAVGAAPAAGAREGADAGPYLDAGLALAAALFAGLALHLRARA